MTDIGKKHWTEQAKKYGSSYQVSWQDIHMINLEIQTLLTYIFSAERKPYRILDIGCGNGYSTAAISDSMAERGWTPDLMVGIDYVPELIEIAKNNYGGRPILFTNGDARSLPNENESFDVVYTTRCLINLLTWEDQQKAIKECLRVTKRGGTILLSEGFWEPLQKLNSFRLMVNLPALHMHDFNRYLSVDKIYDFLSGLGVDFKIIDFSSLYYLGSRVLREIVSPSQGNDFECEINTLFSDIEKKFTCGKLGIGIQNLVVINK